MFAAAESFIAQGGVFAVALTVAFYLLKRSDEREKAAHIFAVEELRIEKAAHEATRNQAADAAQSARDAAKAASEAAQAAAQAAFTAHEAARAALAATQLLTDIPKGTQ